MEQLVDRKQKTAEREREREEEEEIRNQKIRNEFRSFSLKMAQLLLVTASDDCRRMAPLYGVSFGGVPSPGCSLNLRQNFVPVRHFFACGTRDERPVTAQCSSRSHSVVAIIAQPQVFQLLVQRRQQWTSSVAAHSAACHSTAHALLRRIHPLAVRVGTVQRGHASGPGAGVLADQLKPADHLQSALRHGSNQMTGSESGII